LSKKTLGIFVCVLFIFEWALLAKTSPGLPSIPMSLIWISMSILVFLPLVKDNPLAILIGHPLSPGLSFFWISIPIFMNFLWGIETKTLHITHLATTAALVWTPYLFWQLGNHIRDRVFMDFLLVLSLVLPYKLNALNSSWPLGGNLAGFNAAIGMIGIHVGISLLPARFSLIGIPLQQDRSAWIKGGVIVLCLFIIGMVINQQKFPSVHVPFRQSIPFEFLTIALVYGGIEELFYRGFVMNWLRSLTGSAILSLLIAAGLGGLGSLLPSFAGAATIGLIAGLIYCWTSSLLVSTVLGGALRAALILFYL
jgi:membrane protease YdiL (CAAX protease family)